MKIDNPRYVRDGVHPELHFTLEGRPVVLTPDAKPTLHEAGAVYVGEDLGLPELTVGLGPGGGTTKVGGCTRDPGVFALYDRFLRDCADGTFRPGPAPRPAGAQGP